jgi:hypothetical protein|tara:strand:+ start:88 stop:627 length:540 start_codon:yes stop_codon:yes gene_type:complete
MRTKYGEITIGKIIIALFLIAFPTSLFTGVWGDGDEFGEVLNLPIKDYFIGFSIYIICWITGFVMKLLDFSRKVNVPGFGVNTDKDKDILKIKKKGYFIYYQGSGWNPKKNECRHLNDNVVTSMDRIFYTYGPPFGEIWEFESGVVHWFGMILVMGLVTWTVCVGLPFAVLAMVYSFFF